MDGEDSSRPQKVLNVNVGVLGHVDSGKTSLVKALSTSLSTAALDKNPQSQERGITLDLGFSSFMMDFPEHLHKDPLYASGGVSFDKLQFTLVDCPGHASLIRTIIGGAQIIDMMILVIDINRGIQTQTAECVVIGEITTSKLVIVLNKVDMIPLDEREEKIEKVKKRLRKIFSTTKFAESPMICVSAAVGGERVAAVGGGSAAGSGKGKAGAKSKPTVPRPVVESQGIGDVVSMLTSMVKAIPIRNTSAPFYFAVDHCFAIKGHGTVLTGTVLSGCVSVHDTIELPDLQEQKKVKSMQMFRKPVKTAQQGDRVGICVTGLDPTMVERGVLAAPNSVPLLSSAICLVKKVRYFKQVCRSKQKFHISIGHTTVVASVMFFGAVELQLYLQKQQADKRLASKNATDLTSSPVSALQEDRTSFPNVKFPFDQDFEYQETICAATDDVNVKINSSVKLKRQQDALAPESTPGDAGDELMDSSSSGEHILKHGEEAVQFALLVFQHPVLVPLNSLAIGSRLETDARESVVSATHCRIAFFGPVLCPSAPAEAFAPTAAVTKDKPRIYHWKSKEAEVLRLVDVQKDTGVCTEAIGWKLFSKEAGISKYIGLKLETEEGDVVGYVHSSFGSTGKFKIKFPLGVFNLRPGSRLYVKYKRFIYDKTKTMNQDGTDYTPLSERVAIPLPVGKINLSAHPDDTQGEEDPEEDMHALTPRNVAGFAIDSDGEDDHVIDDILGVSALPKEGKSLDTSNAPSVASTCCKASATAATTSTVPVAAAAGETESGHRRTGTVDSVKAGVTDNECICIVSGAFKMEENIREHAGAVALTGVGQSGVLIGPYAKMGKCKIEFKLGFGEISVGSTIYIITSGSS